MQALEVKLFGVFAITYDKKPLSFGKSSSTKVIKLLQILFAHLENGITREKLIENLYGREEVNDAANNLRVTVHRLKKLLVNSGLPEYDYIKIKKGVYRWDSPFEVMVDALEMERIIRESQLEEESAKKIEMLEAACKMYVGEFMPNASGEDWVVVESVRYKNLYSKALQVVLDWKMEKGEYEEAIRLAAVACELYPFDEWQSVKIDCYIAMNHYKDAMREYEQTARMLVEELGVTPSARMLEQFEIMSGRLQNRPQAINKIQNNLKEDAFESGAFFCTVPGFRDSYRIMSRCMERNGQSVFLLVCTLTDGLGRPLDAGEKLDVMSDTLFGAIKDSLRRSDSFTKYNQAQYLVMLVGTNEEDCQIVINRITKRFARNHKSWEQYLDCGVSSLFDYESHTGPADYRFAGN